MKYRFEVVVMLKAGMADPQGKAVEDALPHMGWTGVTGVRMGKHVELTVEASDPDRARNVVEEVARRLLSNPVIESYRVLDGGARGGSSPGDALAGVEKASGPLDRLEDAT